MAQLSTLGHLPAYNMKLFLSNVCRVTFDIAGCFMVVCFFNCAAFGQTVIGAGTIQVSTLGHVFSPANMVGGPTVKDLFIDQQHSSGGGGVIGSVSANLDTNHQFAITITAPPGSKFLIHVPASGSVQFGGSLAWSSFDGFYAYDTGSVTATFNGLGGSAPSFGNAGARIAQNHLTFGFSSLNSSPFSGDISFTSVTLTGTALTANLGTGILDYHPSTNSANVFYAIYYPPFSQTSDPGRFVKIIPVPTLQIASRPSGVTVSWPTDFTNWVLEATIQLGATNSWTTVTNKPIVSGTNFIVTNAVVQPNRYYRMRAQ